MPDAHVRLSTGLAAAVNLFGFPLELYMIRGMPAIPRWPLYLSMAVGGFLLVITLISKSPKIIRMFPWLFVVNAAAVSFALFMVYAYAENPPPGFVYFQASEFGTLLAAMLAPGFVCGLIAIALHAGSSVFQFFTFPEAMQNHLAPDLPGALFAYAVAGVLILCLRIRLQHLELKSAQAQAEAASIRRVGEAFLSVRDKMNSPVQSIELATALLEKKNAGDQGAVLTQLKESCHRLRELNQLLKQYEKSVDWASLRGGLEEPSK